MTIGLVYASLLGLGVVYAVITAFFGWISDHDFGVHVDVDGGVDAGQPHPISGTVLATFITGFGGAGVVAHYLFEWTLVPGLAVATVSGLVLAAAAFAVLELIFSRTQAGSEFVVDEAVGRSAEVITAIPAGSIGEIAYVVRGQRERAGAREIGGREVAKGRQVVIERISGAVAYVRLEE